MRIGIIGTGNMGRTPGGLWAAAGPEVFFGARNPEAGKEAETLARAHATADVHSGTNQQAADFGDVLLYCPRGIDPADVLLKRHVSPATGPALFWDTCLAQPAGKEG